MKLSVTGVSEVMLRLINVFFLFRNGKKNGQSGGRNFFFAKFHFLQTRIYRGKSKKKKFFFLENLKKKSQSALNF